MKIICFVGEPHSGKTETMKKILLEEFKIILIKPKQPKKDFVLTCKENNKRIGICSYGDTETLLTKYLNLLKDKECEIIICACHPTGKTIDFVKSIDKEFIPIPCIKPTEEQKEDEIWWNTEKDRRIEKFKEILNRFTS